MKLTIKFQVDLLIFFVGISEIPTNISADETDRVASEAQARAANLKITMTHSVQILQGPIKTATTTAVHTELQIKENRKNNFVNFGLPMISQTDLSNSAVL